MRNFNSISRSVSQPPTTIDDLQLIIEHALEELRPAPFSQSITDALPYLHPKGLRLRVQLEENGRKKRSNAAVWNWNPEAGKIVISFERDEAAQPLPAPSAQPTPRAAPITHAAPPAVNPVSSFESEEVTPLQIQQCCEALAKAEEAGKLFIAFKWFRDVELSKYKFDWISSPERRQRVLARTIESGAIWTQRISNPKSPQHPTTTVKLNRAAAPQTMPKRFNPIVVRGEPVSVTIMRDRGSV